MRLVILMMLAILGVAVAVPGIASAQTEDEQPVATDGNPVAPTTPDKPVKARFVGVAGGAIVGGELVVAAEALFGVDAIWPYLTFPLLGAAGGGVGGYFVEKKSVPGAIALLVGGIALVIPTAIAASVATSYDPEDEGAVEDTSRSKFSFEMTPTTKGATEEATSTEVEARPAGAPGTEVTPSDGEGDVTPTPPSSTPSGGGASGQGTPPGGGGQRDRAARQTQRRLAHKQAIERATAGSLLYVSANGRPSLAMPNVSIAPSTVPTDPWSGATRNAGFEVHLPLLRVDLP